MERKLLTERYNGFRIIGKSVVLSESASAAPGAPLLRVTGVFQNWLDENANGRVYPKKVWDRQLREGSTFASRLKNRGVLGVLEHPDDGITRIGDVSHVVTEVRYATPAEISGNRELREGDILGTYEIINTSRGRDLLALHEAKVQFGVSSRGLGTVTRSGGRDVVNEDYDVDTWDVVYTPSVSRARPKALAENQLSGDEAEEPIVENAPPAPGEPEPITPTNMSSKLQEFKGLKTEALRLTKTNFKGLRPSEMAVMTESAEDLIFRAQTLASQDPLLVESSRELTSNIRTYLREMDEEFDEPEAAAEPAAPAEEPVAEAEPVTVDAEAQENITAAVALIRDGLSDDPDAQDVADALEDVVVGAEGDVGDDFEFSDSEVQSLPESARRKYRRMKGSYAKLNKQHERLTNLTANLVEKFNSRGGNLNESKQLATRYNKDTLTLGHALVKAKRPDLYEANAEKLKECRTYKQFEDLVESLVKKSPAKGKAPAKPITESAPAPGQKPAPAAKPKPTAAAPAPANPSQGDQLHESARMVQHARRLRA